MTDELVGTLRPIATALRDEGHPYFAGEVEKAADALEAAQAEIKKLDPDPVVCGCREAMCPHVPIAKLPRQALVDHYKRWIRTAEAERDAAQARVAELEQDAKRYRYAQKKLRIGEMHFDCSGDCGCDFYDRDSAFIDAALAEGGEA